MLTTHPSLSLPGRFHFQRCDCHHVHECPIRMITRPRPAPGPDSGVSIRCHSGTRDPAAARSSSHPGSSDRRHSRDDCRAGRRAGPGVIRVGVGRYKAIAISLWWSAGDAGEATCSVSACAVAPGGRNMRILWHYR
eukprot:760000-Hanusia_phi.AAC.1